MDQSASAEMLAGLEKLSSDLVPGSNLIFFSLPANSQQYRGDEFCFALILDSSLFWNDQCPAMCFCLLYPWRTGPLLLLLPKHRTLHWINCCCCRNRCCHHCYFHCLLLPISEKSQFNFLKLIVDKRSCQ